MANFHDAFVATMNAEGGYVNDPDDSGGETYKGVSRKHNKKWSGWVTVDLLKEEPDFPKNLDLNENLQKEVEAFYEVNYWNKINGNGIEDQDIARSIFDFGVNAGTKTSAKLAQGVVDAKPDGVIGPKTLKKLNAEEKEKFLARFALAKIERYIKICEKNASNRKYFYGWVRRTLEQA